MFSFLLLLALLAAIAIAIIIAVLRVPTPTQRRSNVSSSYSYYSSVDPETERRLHRMVQDRDAVTRLIAYTRKHYPGQAEQWIWEKAISQLERDRHY
jgi:uncharacterized protein YpmS